MYVGNVSSRVYEALLRDVCEEHGIVRSVGFAVDKDTGKSNGFAHIEFAEMSGLESAMKSMEN